MRIIIALCLSLIGGVALAQDPAGVSSEIERSASTSPQEKMAYAQASNQEIAEAEKAVARMLDAARKAGSTDAVECLLSRLTSIRALQSVSERAQGAMGEAISAGNAEKANHEFRKIAVAVSKTRMLRAEANRCSGDQTDGSASTVVDWESFLQEYQDVFDTFDLDELDFGQDPPQISPFY